MSKKKTPLKAKIKKSCLKLSDIVQKHLIKCNDKHHMHILSGGEICKRECRPKDLTNKKFEFRETTKIFGTLMGMIAILMFILAGSVPNQMTGFFTAGVVGIVGILYMIVADRLEYSSDGGYD